METCRSYLDVAMEEARDAYRKKTYPVGAVIVSPEGNIISRGHNRVYSAGDFTSHAEVEAIRKAGSLLMQKGNFEGCTLYTTMEPCLMCCGAILLARIKHVIWLMDDEIHGGLKHLHEIPGIPSSHYVKELKITHATDPSLLEDMQTLMRNWNQKKETVRNRWKQKNKSRLSSVFTFVVDFKWLPSTS